MYIYNAQGALPIDLISCAAGGFRGFKSSSVGLGVPLAAYPTFMVAVRLRLSIGACSLSSTAKLPWANADACFVAGGYCGVFDGVSALPASRAYARKLSGLTRSTLSREGAVVDASAWRRTAVNALQAAVRGAESLDGASTACLACVDLQRRQLSTFVLGDSGWLLYAPSPSGRRLCARSSPQHHRGGAPACPSRRDRSSWGAQARSTLPARADIAPSLITARSPDPGCSPRCRVRHTPLLSGRGGLQVRLWRHCSHDGL